MKFDDLDKKMRVFETSHDYFVVPGVFLVARLDGRGFTRLTKERHRFDAPFDVRFRDLMVETVEHLMQCGFRIVYGYTQSDEISLLFHRDDASFNRKTRKLNSVLAGEASAFFSLQLKDVACFDCRICELPTEALVVDYFRWRNEDAARNALNGHCYWFLRRQGRSDADATNDLLGLSVAQKNELLFQNGVNFNDLPLWQKRGVGVWWKTIEKAGLNPKTGETVIANRRRLHREVDLPMRDKYDAFIGERIEEGSKGA
jgi:tRNA(His) guanylyltransferase